MGAPTCLDCQVVPPFSIILCPLHASAPRLLRQLEHLAGACERFAPHILTDEARAAIAEAQR